jgi:hypothetical protein
MLSSYYWQYEEYRGNITRDDPAVMNEWIQNRLVNRPTWSRCIPQATYIYTPDGQKVADHVLNTRI